jgi:hypothetical protein
MDCQQQKNSAACNCTYPCPRKGLCCECLAYHRSSGELPACYFDARTEKTYDRTMRAYLESNRSA